MIPFSLPPNSPPPQFFTSLNFQSLALLIFYTYLALLVLPFHSNGRLVLIRFLLLDSLMFLTRTTTVSLTSFPQPNPTHKCVAEQNAEHTTFLSAAVAVMGSFPPRACGDLVYSGHMAASLLSCLILTRDRCFHNSRFLQMSAYALAGGAAVSILSCRSHYTVDVVLGAYFAYGLTEWYYVRAEGGESQQSQFLRWIEGRGEKEEPVGSVGSEKGEAEPLLQAITGDYGGACSC